MSDFLPGFEPDVPKEVRPRSAKDDDDALKVGYRKYSGAPMLCQHCIRDKGAGVSSAIRGAAYLRVGPADIRIALCMMHKQEQIQRDQLAGVVPL